MRKLHSSGSSYEQTLGHSRAVQVDDMLFVSATAAVGPDSKIVGDDLYTQTRYILQKLEGVLQEASRAHGEVFGDIRPALTLLHVLPFVDPAMLVEVEITARKSASA
jgi:enamine deaminase RidA (YjgF/YER057c/UK114 family)